LRTGQDSAVRLSWLGSASGGDGRSPNAGGAGMRGHCPGSAMAAKSGRTL